MRGQQNKFKRCALNMWGGGGSSGGGEGGVKRGGQMLGVLEKAGEERRGGAE